MPRLKEKFFTAKKLREKGYSLKEISEKLNIAKGTSSVWLRDIELSKEALKRLEKRKLLGRVKSSETKRRRREERYKLLNLKSEKVLSFTKINKNHLKLLCAVLYWCEGSKDPQKNGIHFINSDPQMIKTFLNLFRSAFDLREDKFRACVHLHSYHSPIKQLRFWSNLTKIPLKQFYKPYRKPNTRKRIKENYQGCISIRYHDSNLGCQLKSLYEIFAKKYGGVR